MDSKFMIFRLLKRVAFCQIVKFLLARASVKTLLTILIVDHDNDHVDHVVVPADKVPLRLLLHFLAEYEPLSNHRPHFRFQSESERVFLAMLIVVGTEIEDVVWVAPPVRSQHEQEFHFLVIEAAEERQ